jgi:hypothetical protein
MESSVNEKPSYTPTHQLKTIDPYFSKIWDGDKTLELCFKVFTSYYSCKSY